MAKPRNWHAVNAHFRKAGPHGGTKRPHLSKCDDIDEHLDIYDYDARGMAYFGRLRVPCNEVAGEIHYEENRDPNP